MEIRSRKPRKDTPPLSPIAPTLKSSQLYKATKWSTWALIATLAAKGLLDLYTQFHNEPVQIVVKDVPWNTADFMWNSTATKAKSTSLIELTGVSEEMTKINDKWPTSHCIPKAFVLGAPYTGTGALEALFDAGLEGNYRLAQGKFTVMDYIKCSHLAKNSPIHGSAPVNCPPLVKQLAQQGNKDKILQEYFKQSAFHRSGSCDLPKTDVLLEKVLFLEAGDPAHLYSISPNAHIYLLVRNPIDRFIDHFTAAYGAMMEKCLVKSVDESHGFLFEQGQNFLSGLDEEYSMKDTYKLGSFLEPWKEQLEKHLPHELELWTDACSGRECEWWQVLETANMQPPKEESDSKHHKRHDEVDQEEDDLHKDEEDEDETGEEDLIDDCVNVVPHLGLGSLSLLAYGMLDLQLSTLLQHYTPSQIHLITWEDLPTHIPKLQLLMEPWDVEALQEALALQLSQTAKDKSPEALRALVEAKMSGLNRQIKLSHSSWIPKSVLTSLKKFYAPSNQRFLQLLESNGWTSLHEKLKNRL